MEKVGMNQAPASLSAAFAVPHCIAGAVDARDRKGDEEMVTVAWPVAPGDSIACDRIAKDRAVHPRERASSQFKYGARWAA